MSRPVGSKNKALSWRHGTKYGYLQRACRCDACREAWRIEKALYRARRKLREQATGARVS